MAVVVLGTSMVGAWIFAAAEWKSAGGLPAPGYTSLHPLAAEIAALLDRAYVLYAEHQLAALGPIDAHTHITNTGPAFVQMLDGLHMHVLDILYVDDTTPTRGPLDRQRQEALSFIASSHGRATLCTTFDPVDFDHPNFAQQAIDSLNRDFTEGAVAAKVWKNIGMEFKNSAGHYIMPDDPIFQAIYRDIAQQGKTLIIHAADPDRAWEPGAVQIYSHGYFESHPQWDMSKQPNPPRKADILKARNEVVAANRDLRVVGAHLGSLDEHLDDLAALFDRYPNFAVDLSGRMLKLTRGPRDKMRAFILRYQDRLLYGTDLSFNPGESDAKSAESWHAVYMRDWRYLATNDKFDIVGQTVQGLNLPHSVLKKLYHDNAVRWVPGIIPATQ